VRGQEHGLVAKRLDLSRPVVGRAAGFHHDGGLRQLGEGQRELLARVPLLLGHLTGVVGDGNLEHRLCQIDCDESIFRHGWAPSFAYTASDCGT
jgi:hypothetical protein